MIVSVCTRPRYQLIGSRLHTHLLKEMEAHSQRCATQSHFKERKKDPLGHSTYWSPHCQIPWQPLHTLLFLFTCVVCDLILRLLKHKTIHLIRLTVKCQALPGTGRESTGREGTHTNTGTNYSSSINGSSKATPSRWFVLHIPELLLRLVRVACSWQNNIKNDKEGVM